jgi:hypothetical protein
VCSATASVITNLQNDIATDNATIANDNGQADYFGEQATQQFLTQSEIDYFLGQQSYYQQDAAWWQWGVDAMGTDLAANQAFYAANCT